MLGNRKRILDGLNEKIANDINGTSDLQIRFKYGDIQVANASMVSNFAFDPLTDVDLVYLGEHIDKSFIQYNSNPSFDGTKNGVYEVTYTATYKGFTTSRTRIIKVVDSTVNTYDFTATFQTFVANSDGLYEIELWGAQGVYGYSTVGYGAYTKGEIILSKKEVLYVYVGEGIKVVRNGTTFNGGTADSGGWPGGGATDIRLVSGSWNNFDSLKSRIMVAGGSGAADGDAAKSGSGGTLIGKVGGATSGGTQTTFGLPQSTISTVSSFGYAKGGCTGGNGYYPGGGSSCANGSGGGSSFISGHTGCDAIAFASSEDSIIHTGQSIHYSGKVFTNTLMISGDDIMPNHEGTGTMHGNSGHGYAKITSLITFS